MYRSHTVIRISPRKRRAFRRQVWDSVGATVLLAATVIAASTYLYFGALSDCHNMTLTARAAVHPGSPVCALLP